MSRGDRRLLLESIAFGDDPSIRPADRLHALEMLDDVANEEPGDFRVELANLSGEQLDLELDAYLGGRVVASAVAGEHRFPIMEAALAAAIEDCAGELADVDRIEAEIERRAAELAERMYVEGGLGEIERQLGAG
jgi:hypothetical protein